MQQRTEDFAVTSSGILLSPGETRTALCNAGILPVVLNGKSVQLSHTEFEILSHLVRRPRVVVSRADLTASGGGRSVDVHLSRVRTKLGSFGRLVTTVRGTGYRFDPDAALRVITEPVALRSA